MPPGRSERLQQVLTGAGAAVTMLWQESGHLLSPGELEDVAGWWRRTVAGLG